MKLFLIVEPEDDGIEEGNATWRVLVKKDTADDSTGSGCWFASYGHETKALAKEAGRRFLDTLAVSVDDARRRYAPKTTSTFKRRSFTVTKRNKERV